jgi:predicted dehydrogenase
MAKLKLAIIGMGRMGITHYSIINSHPDIEIESVVDPSSLILTMLHKHIPANIFSDYNEMFEKTKPDAVLVCTPPNLNYHIIKKAAEKGIHAFVEKPFATLLPEALELTQLYTNNGLVNQVGYVNRFNDVFLKLKEFVGNGVIGNVIRFKSEMFSCLITKLDEGASWRASHESGGGVIFELASHAIDLINFIIGKPDKIIGSSLNYIHSKNVEDAAFSTFIYKNGITGNLNVNYCDTSYRKPTNKIEIFGDNGRILVDQHSLRVFLNKKNDQYNLRPGWNTLYITDIFKPVPFYVRGNEFTSQLYHFIDCIQKRNITTKCSFADGLNTLEVIDGIFKDFEQNGRV